MKPDLEFSAGSVPGMSHRHAYALVGVWVALAAVLALYWPTAVAMAHAWSSSGTFKHGPIVLPIVAWLLWRQRNRVPIADARPFWPALTGLAAAGCAWLAGNVASVAGVQAVALVVMLQATVLAMLGPAVTRSIAFPLAFLFFAAPVGDFLIPVLMDWTADFTVWALRATGIPVFREGNSFVIPSGSWSVVEACSGIRYLVAALMVGTLYAYLTYRSNLRRLAFVVASIVVSVVANWLRAYLIVMLGHYTSNTFAAGADHLVYGWIFFGLVIALLFWIGSIWRQDRDGAALAALPHAQFLNGAGKPKPPWSHAALSSLLAVILVAATWPALARVIEAHDETGPVQLVLPEGVEGWQRGTRAAPAWSPSFVGTSAMQSAAYEGAGREVEVYVAYYRRQAQGRELVTSDNVLVSSTVRHLHERALAALPLRWPGGGVDARSSEVIAKNDRWVTASWYWIDGAVTANDYQAKVRQAIAKLRLRGDDGAAVVLVTPNENTDEARATLKAFASEMAPALMQALKNARGRA